MKPALSNHAMRALAMTGIMAVAGCAFAPPAHPPASASPDQYAAEATPTTSALANGVAQHFQLGARAVPDWWREYGNDVLNGWVEEGLRNNPSLEVSQRTLDAAHDLLRAQVGATMLPSLDAGAQASREQGLGLPEIGPKTNRYNVYTGAMQLSYDFDIFGVNRHGIEATAARVDQESYEVDAARRALAANIVITAIQAASLAEQLDRSEKLASLGRKQADLTAIAYRLGAASHDDLLAAQQDAGQLDAAVPSLRTQAMRARHALAVLLGRAPERAPANLELSQLKLPADVPVSVPSDLLQQRPDVLAAEAAVRAASAQVGVATANLFPHISLSASLGSAGFHPDQLSSMWSTGLSLTQPIFHGGALLAERKAAQAEYEAALAQYRQTVLNAFQNVADTLTALDQDAETLQAAQAAAGAAHQSFVDTDSRYRAGALSYPETLVSEQRWQNAKLMEIQARATRLEDTAALFQSMGTPSAKVIVASRDLGALPGGQIAATH